MKIIKPPSKQPLPKDARRVFKGVIFDVYQWQQIQFDGSLATFEKLVRPDTVMVLPVTPEKKIVLALQEQPGKKPVISAFGGRVDPGEDILAAAKRELLEESGFTAKELVLFDAQQPISKMEWAIYTFIAKDIKKVANQDLESGEKIDPMYVTFNEFVDLVITEKFGDTEILIKFLRAKLDPELMEKYRKMFLE
ncbi:MAG TPA: NUDIX hydrolase [Candidatus Dojkabacteria bacterium]|nr:NUDIX hydrolase [Candidatus Dojkabacteria bacterium]